MGLNETNFHFPNYNNNNNNDWSKIATVHINFKNNELVKFCAQVQSLELIPITIVCAFHF